MDGVATNYSSSEPVILGVRTTGVVRGSNLSKDRSSNNHWHGEIAEVLVYNEPLPTSAMRMVEGYLAHKWGTVSTLQNSHPYKNYAPYVVLLLLRPKSIGAELMVVKIQPCGKM